MKKIPNIKDLKAPEGYFDELPEEIMGKISKKEQYPWIKWAASILVIFGIGVWQYSNYNSVPTDLLVDQEIDLFIESQYWSAEDILSMSENPDEILNEIIQEENPFMDVETYSEEEIWF